MPKNSAEYQREYRKRNLDKIRAYERERCKRRAGKSECKVVQDMPGVKLGLSDPIASFRRCMASFCKSEGQPVIIEGCTVYLCNNHKPK